MLRFAAFLAFMALCSPAAAETGPFVTCPPDGAMSLIEERGMSWHAPGFAPEDLAKLDLAKITAYAGAWADAYRAAGVSRVLLPDFAKPVSSWGALERVPGKTFGRYDFFVLDAIVEVYSGIVVVPVSSDCSWDQHDGILPVNAAAFAGYVKAIAERYDGDTEFGVPVQDESYPDIDGSGKVTSADWEASKSEKQAWADRHRIAGLEVGTTAVPEGVPKDQYAKLVVKVAEASRAVAPDLDVWLAPFETSIGKADFNARFGALGFDQGGVRKFDVAVVDCTDMGKDMTLQNGLDKFTAARKWFADAGIRVEGQGAVMLVAGGARFGNREQKDVCNSPQCSGETQTEQMVKALALFAVEGAVGLGYLGIPGQKDSQGAAALATLDPVGTPPVLVPMPALLVSSVVSRALSTGGSSKEVLFGTAAARAVQGQACKTEADVVVWYDWTTEVGPGAPYGGLTKVVNVKPTMAGQSVAWTLAPAAPGPVNLVPGASLTIDLAPATVTVADTGSVGLQLGRAPVLLVTRESLSPPDETVSDMAEIAGDDISPEQDKPKGGGGCAAGMPGGIRLSFISLLAGIIVLVARRFDRHCLQGAEPCNTD